MKISFSLLILLITKILTQTTDEVIYSDEEGFERDIQPTPPPPPVPQVLPNESENNSSDPSANNVEPSRFLPIRQIYGEALIRGAPGVRGLIYFINSVIKSKPNSMINNNDESFSSTVERSWNSRDRLWPSSR